MINIPYPSQKSLDTFFDDVKVEILKRINAVVNSKTISVDSQNIRVTKQIKNILNWLYIEKNLKRFLLAKPNDIIKIISYIEIHFKKARYSKEALNKIFFRIFVDYGYNKLDKLKFIKNINLGSCPYCNRNYIFSINKRGSVKPEIDHFYPKSLYPYLSISYFNLIPSCPTCNGFGAKEGKDTFYVYPIHNPYTLKEVDFKFSILPLNVDFYNSVEKEKYNYDNFEIELYGNKSNLDVFKLVELYKQHKDIVLELLIKKTYYPKSYIEELKRFGFSKDEIYRYLLCNYSKDEELHKRPLSKLIKDISEELEILDEY